MQTRLVQGAREAARTGESILPGSEQFWLLVAVHLREVSDLLTDIQAEVDEEVVASQSEARECIVCRGPVVKRHKKGRWPLYCEHHSLADR
jgi:hypothetical protein